MSFLETFLVAIGLAMDSFAVALSSASRRGTGRWAEGASMIVHFAVFQGGMTLVGWAIGLGLATWITAVDHWIAFALLAFVGARMIHEGRSGDADAPRDTGRWLVVLALAIATSIDAMAVGLGLAFLEIDARGPAVVVGAVTALLTAAGFAGGRALGHAFGDRMQIVGGLVLLFIGGRILVTHLVSHGIG